MNALILITALLGADPDHAEMLSRAKIELARLQAELGIATPKPSHGIHLPLTGDDYWPEDRKPSHAVVTPQPPAADKGPAPGVQTKPKVTITITQGGWCAGCNVVKPWLDDDDLPFDVDIKYSDDNVPYIEWIVNDVRYRFDSRYWPTKQNVVGAWRSTPADDTTDQKTSAEAAPTPQSEIDRILALAPAPQVGFVDFGCGDGRWCIAAARRWGCKATGVEIDPERAAEAASNVAKAGMGHLVTIVVGDATQTDVDADVGVAYLYPETLSALRPKIERLAWFASYMHPVPGIAMTKSGDAWLCQRRAVHSDSQSQIVRDAKLQQDHQATFRRPFAVYQGQVFYGPCCNDLGCGMRQNIVQQLRARGYTGR